MTTQGMTLETLPTEIIFQIAENLPPKDIAVWRLCCQKFAYTLASLHLAVTFDIKDHDSQRVFLPSVRPSPPEVAPLQDLNPLGTIQLFKEYDSNWCTAVPLSINALQPPRGTYLYWYCWSKPNIRSQSGSCQYRLRPCACSGADSAFSCLQVLECSCGTCQMFLGDLCRQYMINGDELAPRFPPFSPVHIAAILGDDKLMEFVLQQCIHVHFDNGRSLEDRISPLYLSIIYGHITIAKQLLQWKHPLSMPGFRSTTLHCAAAEGRLDLVEYITTHYDQDINAKDAWGFTPLMHYISLLHTPRYPRSMEENILSNFIRLGADVNVQTSDKYTTLRISLLIGRFDIALRLLEEGYILQPFHHELVIRRQLCPFDGDSAKYIPGTATRNLLVALHERIRGQDELQGYFNLFVKHPLSPDQIDPNVISSLSAAYRNLSNRATRSHGRNKAEALRQLNQLTKDHALHSQGAMTCLPDTSVPRLGQLPTEGAEKTYKQAWCSTHGLQDTSDDSKRHGSSENGRRETVLDVPINQVMRLQQEGVPGRGSRGKKRVLKTSPRRVKRRKAFGNSLHPFEELSAR